MTTTAPTTSTVRSADGTTIGFEQSGAGPAVVLVDGATCYRANGPLRPMAELLADAFTVLTYDRRGRGESGDTLPYAIDCEVDDLAALIDEAGGSAFVYGVSSGGLLALHAAASGLPIPKLALFEPPIGDEDERDAEAAFTAEIADLVAAGRRRAAVTRFMTSIGVPAEVIDQMEPSMPVFEAIAHTIVYDCTIANATSLDVVRSVTAPTLVLDSEGSTGDLTGWAAAVVDALPNGTHRSLVGQWHQVPDEDLAPVLTDYFLSSTVGRSAAT